MISLITDSLINIISEENVTGFYHGRIDKDFLQKHIENFKQPFYVCGPDAFTTSILNALKELGAHPDSLVFEK